MRIIKRKDYFYLQHSYRKDGKVVTRERYLGKSVPKNTEELKQELQKESNEVLLNKLERIKSNFQKEWKSLPETARQRELHEIAIAFTYNTNAIEGSTITQDEVREVVQDRIAPNKPIRDIKETEAHYDVFLDILNSNKQISKQELIEWHRRIFQQTKADIAGKYRTWLVRVGSYVAPDWQDVKKLMKKLVKYMLESKENPVFLSAKAHYQFEKIHPFGDGNGRIGRLLMNYLLWKEGYPMLIIEYKKRKSYYKAFRKGEEGFVKYFVRRYLTVHKKRIK